MSNGVRPSRSKRGFFSFDAAIALVLALTALVSYSAIFAAAARGAADGAHEQSMSGKALRLSSFILDEAGAKTGGSLLGAYVSAGELDLGRVDSLDLGWVGTRLNLKYIQVKVKSGGAEISNRNWGTAPAREVFCAKRIGLYEGEMAVLECCVG